MGVLKKKELEKFQVLLEEEKRKILHHLEELSDSTGKDEINLNSGDQADIASLEIDQANLQKIGKREKYLLKKIDAALARIKDGTYGECESCGEAISVARLMARPVAQLCIDCKTEQESQEKRFTSRDLSDEEGAEFAEESEEG